MKKKIFLFLKFILILISCSVTTVYARKMAVKSPSLVIEPTSLQMGLDQEHEFVARGGKPPYVFKTTAGLIRYQGNTATFISPNESGEAIVTVKDANGLTRSAVIQFVSDKSPSAP